MRSQVSPPSLLATRTAEKSTPSCSSSFRAPSRHRHHVLWKRRATDRWDSLHVDARGLDVRSPSHCKLELANGHICFSLEFVVVVQIVILHRERASARALVRKTMTIDVGRCGVYGATTCIGKPSAVRWNSSALCTWAEYWVWSLGAWYTAEQPDCRKSHQM